MIQKQYLGSGHPDTSRTRCHLAELYRHQGKYAQAEQLFLQAQDFQQRGLGPDHPDAIHSLYQLAKLYEDQGKYEQAEGSYQRSLKMCEQKLGLEHPETRNISTDYMAFHKKKTQV